VKKKGPRSGGPPQGKRDTTSWESNIDQGVGRGRKVEGGIKWKVSEKRYPHATGRGREGSQTLPYSTPNEKKKRGSSRVTTGASDLLSAIIGGGRANKERGKDGVETVKPPREGEGIGRERFKSPSFQEDMQKDQVKMGLKKKEGFHEKKSRKAWSREKGAERGNPEEEFQTLSRGKSRRTP